ncbi:MAG: replication initiator protein A [Abditibacteriota bacterium]|nr:replication initiator protein A [Abditibacteriota bacterium]
MATAISLDYCYGDELKIDSFCRLPRILLTSELYRKLALEVKYLYCLMLDRVSLSMRNGWRDKDGRVIIYFTLNDVQDLLNVGKNKAVKLFNQLETLGFIRRRKQGQGKPARVFVRIFVEKPKENAENVSNATPDCGEVASDGVEMSTPETEIAPEAEVMAAAEVMEAPPFEEPTTAPEPAPISIHDVRRPAASPEERAVMPDAPQGGIAGLLSDCAVGVRRLGDILTQCLSGGGIPMTANSAGIAANAAPVARKEASGQPVYEKSAYYLGAYEGDKWRNASLIRKEIVENLELSMIRDEDAMEQIHGYVDIMVQACCGQTPTVRINGSEYSRATVRQRMYQLDATHLEYVYDCVKECAPKVRNLRAYILTALFNSYDTIDLYYETKVAHDMSKAYEDEDDD